MEKKDVIALQYAARKEDFQKAITDATLLDVLAVYADGRIVRTNFTGSIISTLRMDESNVFLVRTQNGKRDLKITVI